MLFRKTTHDLPYLGLGAALLFALVLRLINIGAEPYWGDEILSLDIMTSFASAAEMVRYLADVEFHPPLYYLVMRPWIAVFGATEVATRMVSVLAGLGVVAGGWYAGRRILNSPLAGNVAAFVLAVLPLQIEYGQEARPYMLFVLCGVLAMLALWRHLEDGKPWSAAAYVAASVVGAYLHYSYLFVFAPMAMWWLLMTVVEPERRTARGFASWLFAHAAAGFALFFWATPFLHKVLIGKYEIMGLPRRIMPWREPAFIERVLHEVVWQSKQDAVAKIEIFSALLAKLALAWGVLLLHVDRAHRKLVKSSVRPVVFLLWMTLVPVVLFLFAPQSVEYTRISERHVVFVTVPIALLIGWVVSSLRDRRGFAILAIFMVSLVPSVASIVGNDYLWDHDHRLEEAGEFIGEHYRDGDLLIVSASILRSDLSHYLPEEVPVEVMLPIDYFGKDVWRSRHTLGLIENELQVRIPKAAPDDIAMKLDRLDRRHSPDRIWLYGFGEGDHSVRDWFSRHGWRTVYRPIGGIFRVELFERK